MGRTPSGLAAPEVSEALGVPRAIVEGWMERGLLPSRTGDDRVRRTSRRNVTVLQETSALDSGKRWTEADWEALLDRLGPVLRDPTSLRPSLLGRFLDYFRWPLP